MTLEENFTQLEEHIKKLEDKEISLEEAFRLYQEGMQLLKECNSQIDGIEKKVQVLNENGKTEDFN